MNRKPTTEKLAEALELMHAPPAMIKRAHDGYYDDFKSPLEKPIVALVRHALQAGLKRIAERAINGEFDAEPWEAEEWANSPEGQEVRRQFGL